MSAQAPKRLPVLATLVVALSVAAMIGLGIWQLQRREWKEHLLARYRAAETVSAEVPFPRTPEAVEAVLYRRSSLICERVLATNAIAGRSIRDETGWAHIATCALADEGGSGSGSGGTVDVAFGWSRAPILPDWRGGKVSGWVAPAGKAARLVTSPPQMGLTQLARPDPNDLPNNHLSYAFQWFFFAATALVIYVLALRRRWREGG